MDWILLALIIFNFVTIMSNIFILASHIKNHRRIVFREQLKSGRF